MSKYRKLLGTILCGSSDNNIVFSDLCNLLTKLGFNERIKGDHHIFTNVTVEEIINIQPKESKAKPYQVKQIRKIILKYHLGEKNV